MLYTYNSCSAITIDKYLLKLQKLYSKLKFIVTLYYINFIKYFASYIYFIC